MVVLRQGIIEETLYFQHLGSDDYLKDTLLLRTRVKRFRSESAMKLLYLSLHLHFTVLL